MKRRTREEEKIAKRRQRAAGSLVAPPKSFALSAMPGILPFQREWLAKAFAADIDLGALSAARGSGKSTLAGWVAACAVAPEGALTRARRGGPDCRADNEPRARGAVGRACTSWKAYPIYAGAIRHRGSVCAICRRLLSAGYWPRRASRCWAMAHMLA